MKAEKPALGISRSDTWNDAHVYHVECSCTDPDHAVDAWIEVGHDPDFHDEVTVTFFVKTDFSWWQGIGERLKLACKILLGRGHQQEHSLILDKQAALNFGAAIEASIEDLENGNS